MTAKEGVKKYLGVKNLTRDQKKKLKVLDYIEAIRNQNGTFCPKEYKKMLLSTK